MVFCPLLREAWIYGWPILPYSWTKRDLLFYTFLYVRNPVASVDFKEQILYFPLLGGGRERRNILTGRFESWWCLLSQSENAKKRQVDKGLLLTFFFGGGCSQTCQPKKSWERISCNFPCPGLDLKGRLRNRADIFPVFFPLFGWSRNFFCPNWPSFPFFCLCKLQIHLIQSLLSCLHPWALCRERFPHLFCGEWVRVMPNLLTGAPRGTFVRLLLQLPPEKLSCKIADS